MRSILVSIALLLSLVCVSQAAVAGTTPTLAATNAAYAWEVDSSRTTAYDTLVGVDSVTFLTKYPVEMGWEYILWFGTVSGTGSDSVAIAIRAQMYNAAGTLTQIVTFDSTITATTEAMMIPIGSQLFGSRITLKGIGYTGNGGQVILDKYQIIKRRPVNITKPWTVK